MIRKKYYLLLLFYIPCIQAAGILETLERASQKLRNPTEMFKGVLEERQNQLSAVTQERQEFLTTQKVLGPKYRTILEETKGQINRVQDRLKQETNNEFLKQKITLLNEIYQAVKDIQRVREQLLTVYNELIKLLTEYSNDSEFAQYKQEHKLHERLYYTFEDVQRLHDIILEQEKRLLLVTEQEKSAHVELENLQKSLAVLTETYKRKKEAIEKVNGEKVSVQQNRELMRLEEQLYNHRKMVDELRIKEVSNKIKLFDIQIFVNKSQLSLLKDYLRMIKPLVRVSETDVTHAQEELAQQKQHYFQIKEEQRKELETIAFQQKSIEKELEATNKAYAISLGKDVDDWTREPQQTVNAYVTFYIVAALNTRLLALQKQHELIDAQIALADEKFKYASLKVQVKGSYQKITAHTYIQEDEIKQELKKYDAPQAEAKASLSRYKEKIIFITDLLNIQKKVLDNIEAHKTRLMGQQDLLFKDSPSEFALCFDLLNQAEQDVKDQIDMLSKLTSSYSSITTTINEILELIDFITSELEVLSKWHLQRPEYAISLQGIQSILPDIGTFLHDIRLYIIQFSLTNFVNKLKGSFKQPMQLIIFIIKMIGVLLCLLFFHRYAPLLAQLLKRMSDYYFGLFRVLLLFSVVVLSFIQMYFFGISIWVILFALLRFQLLIDYYLYIFFYLFSIPYLMYLANRFMEFLIQFNQENKFAILAPDFQRRFFWVISALLYATIAIMLFREAFMLAHYYRSELPTILLAVNFIIFQISLILLIGKEQILNLIPTTNDFWLWMRSQVDRYYYVILLGVIAIIIMSNPYVGFGTLVLYMLFALVYTGLLILGLFWLHGAFKKIASKVFFSTEDDFIRERFTNAKTWFGLLIIASFLTITFAGVIIGARIWGWSITLHDVYYLIHTPFIGEGTRYPVTVIALGKIILFIFGGVFVSYALNRLVLDKIFDLLLVEPGVQHTVATITQYLIVMVAVFLGFHSVGLGEQVGYVLAALTLSLGWVLKEPLSDFIAYFIILVQRPLKIGDYVRIDQETTGVVRHITARNVILRRLNSTTVIVPNSYVISRSIMNWNYTRNFIAFDDILIRVDYRENPTRVKELLVQAVESHPNVLKNPRPIVRLDDFAENGYLFLVRGFLSSVYTLEQWDIASDVRLIIIKKLRDNNIKIAVPVRLRLEDQAVVPATGEEKK